MLMSHNISLAEVPYFTGWNVGGVLISLSQAIEPVGESVTHGQCDA